MTALAKRHGRVLDLTHLADLDDAAYDALDPVQWGGRHPLRDRFPTPDGRARLISVVPSAPLAHDAAYPFRLNTGRYRDQWHTMTRTGQSPTLSRHRREPLLEVHPADAAAHGLIDGGLARVATTQGQTVFRVALNDGQRPGDLFVPMHWTDTMASGARANRLPGQATDPHSGQPGFKHTPARLEAVIPDWRAFVVTTGDIAPAPDALWWCRARVRGGWLHELAGMGEPALDAVLPHGARLEAADPRRGMQRIALLDPAGALLAALFITRTGTLPPRDWIAGLLGTTGASALELLAGRPATPAPDRGEVVCVCHDVCTLAITTAAGQGAGTVAAIGQATRAGTNCGSCRPAIARLLAQASSLDLEAAE
jgi:assimilatory nitrate reductase catalytic subunit